MCDFYNINILCYQPNTCTDMRYDKYSKLIKCSKEDIDEMKIINNINENSNNLYDPEIKMSKDCKMLYSFLGRRLNEDCCKSFCINCEDGYITKLVIQISLIKMTFLPNTLFNLPELKTLQINYTGLKEISESINKNSTLETINLNNSNISKFPSQLIELSNLKYLSLIANKINGVLPKHLKDSSISILNIKKNNLSGQLIVPKKAREIYAEDNKFDSIYYGYNNSPLENLYLKNNIFTDNVFISLSQFKKLENLDISDNKNIESIPQNIGQMKNLKKLDLSNLNLKNISNEIFNLSNLESLSLDNNQELKSIPQNIDNLTKLNF
eukprot:jgi/Orpsp1_1/1179472/evm.model.c7180000069460.1